MPQNVLSLEVEADLVECAFDISVLIPALPKTFFTQPDTTD